METPNRQQNTGSQPARRPNTLTRRAVLRIGAMVGISLPLIITLTPTEARAQATGS